MTVSVVTVSSAWALTALAPKRLPATSAMLMSPVRMRLFMMCSFLFGGYWVGVTVGLTWTIKEHLGQSTATRNHKIR